MFTLLSRNPFIFKSCKKEAEIKVLHKCHNYSNINIVSCMHVKSPSTSLQFSGQTWSSNHFGHKISSLMSHSSSRSSQNLRSSTTRGPFPKNWTYLGRPQPPQNVSNSICQIIQKSVCNNQFTQLYFKCYIQAMIYLIIKYS